jgi:tetratricopeptide (TPR) repeat protein
VKIFFYISIFVLFFNFFIFSQDQTSDSTTNNTTETEENNDVNTPKNGWVLYQEGRYYDSIVYLKQEMKQYPSRINVYVILGWDYRQLRRYKDMEEISIKGLKVNSTDIRLIRNLGESYFFQNKYSSAIKEFEKYISYRYNKNDSYLPTIYYYLGVCFYNQRLFKKADIAMSTARYFQPNNNRIILFLGKIMVELKEYEKAKKYFNDVLKKSPNNTEAIEGLKRIKDFQ